MNIIVQDTLDRTHAISTMPVIALRIMQVADDPNATASDIDALICSDPPMAARTLKVVNSAYYGRSGKVSTTLSAIQLLGVTAIRNIAVAASLSKLFHARQAIDGFDPSALWAHSVAVGVAARRIASISKAGLPDEAMLAGVLHDIGLMLVMQAWYPEFKQTIETVRDDPDANFVEIERHVLGATHEEFGEALCAQWHFPQSIVLSAGHHHAPLSMDSDERLPAVVHLADVMAARAEIGYKGTVSTREFDPVVMARVGITEDQLTEIQNTLAAEVADAATVLTS